MEAPLAAPSFAGGVSASSAFYGLPLFADCCASALPVSSASAVSACAGLSVGMGVSNATSGCGSATAVLSPGGSEGFLLNPCGVGSVAGVANSSSDAWAARACAFHLFGCARESPPSAETIPELLLPGFEEAALTLASASSAVPVASSPAQATGSGCIGSGATSSPFFGTASSLNEDNPVFATATPAALVSGFVSEASSLSGDGERGGREGGGREGGRSADERTAAPPTPPSSFGATTTEDLSLEGAFSGASVGSLAQTLPTGLLLPPVLGGNAALGLLPSTAPVGGAVLALQPQQTTPLVSASSSTHPQSFERLTSQLLSSIAGMKELVLRDRNAEAGDLLVEASAQLDVHLANASNSATELHELLREDLLASQNLAPLIEAAQEQQRKIVRLHSHLLRHHPAYAELLRRDSRLGQWISELETLHGESKHGTVSSPVSLGSSVSASSTAFAKVEAGLVTQTEQTAGSEKTQGKCLSVAERTDSLLETRCREEELLPRRVKAEPAFDSAVESGV